MRHYRNVIVGCSLASVAVIATLTVCLYRCRYRRRPTAVDPEPGDGQPSDRGRLAVVHAPPPVPDLCPYTPQVGDLDPVGQSPAEQYAADCRATRAGAWSAGGPTAFNVGGPGNDRCVMEDEIGQDRGGGTHSENALVGALSAPVATNLSTSKWNAAKPRSAEVDQVRDDDDDDDDNSHDDNHGGGDDAKVMITKTNGNGNYIRNNNNNNNNNEDEDERVASLSEKGVLSTSTNSSGSR